MSENKIETFETLAKRHRALLDLWMSTGEIPADIETQLAPATPATFLPNRPEEDPLATASDDPDKGLGRLVSVDFRDASFPLSKALPKGSSGLIYRYWNTGPILDQGNTSQCVAYAGEQYLTTGPVVNKFYKTPAELYKECQQNDEWAGEDYDGTSVRALFKVLQSRGYIKEYRWAFDVRTVVRHLLEVGPVVMGTNWYNSMFYPDAITGFITVRGSSGLAGGHAYMLSGTNDNKLCPDGSRGAVRLVNSWGREWGQKGYAFMSYIDLARLIREWGEAGAATEIKFVEQAKG